MSQTIEWRGPSGDPLTAQVFAYGSDVQVGTDVSGTEATNRKGLFIGTLDNDAEGLHTLHVFSGVTCVAVYDVDLQGASQHSMACDLPQPAAAYKDSGGGGGGVTVETFTGNAIDQLKALKNINVIGQGAKPGQLLIVIGDDYLTSIGTQRQFPNAKGDWPDLDGATITFQASRELDDVVTPMDDVEGVVITPTGSGQRVDVDLPKDWTGSLTEGEWGYAVLAELAGGEDYTLEYGVLTAVERVPQ